METKFSNKMAMKVLLMSNKLCQSEATLHKDFGEKLQQTIELLWSQAYQAFFLC